MDLQIGQDVFLAKVEYVWNKPYPMKRSDDYDIRSTILKAEVKEVKGNEFKALLHDNNGFEKDGEVFVFNHNQLLCDQNFKDLGKLGKWQNHS